MLTILGYHLDVNSSFVQNNIMSSIDHFWNFYILHDPNPASSSMLIPPPKVGSISAQNLRYPCKDL